MKQTICAECDYLNQKIAKDWRPSAWQCLAPQTGIPNPVTGQEKKRDVLCQDKNTGNCKHFIVLIPEPEPEPEPTTSWWMRPYTENFGFWSRVIINTICNLLGFAILYLWIKTHGGILPW